MRLQILVCSLLFMTQAACAFSHTVPVIEATAETDPIPFGTKDTDDAAIWLNHLKPSESLILGTSKVTPSGDRRGGLGVYDLSGRQKQFLLGDKLNNVDVARLTTSSTGVETSLAVASNRTANGLDVFSIQSNGNVQKEQTIPLIDSQGKSITPYGLCTAIRQGQLEVFLPTKKGTLYRFRVNPTTLATATLIDTFDLSTFVSADDDTFIKSIVEKTARKDDELDKLPEMLAERFVLEACTYQGSKDRLFVGMENFGIWTVNLGKVEGPSVAIFQKISGSWTDIDSWSQNEAIPRITDDIEGMDVFAVDDREYLVVSSQGISEFNLFDLSTNKILGNFKIRLGSDEVTETDGVATLASPLSQDLPEGVLVVHDDRNTNDAGSADNANYKIVSLKKILDALLKTPVPGSHL
jgi:3-phytase